MFKDRLAPVEKIYLPNNEIIISYLVLKKSKNIVVISNKYKIYTLSVDKKFDLNDDIDLE